MAPLALDDRTIAPVEGPTPFERAWADRRVALLIAAGVVVAAALVSAWLTPRGPLTTGEALTSMVLAVAVGVAVGVLSGSRWSMLLAPALYIAVFELSRIGTAGPTVDAIWPTSMIGAMVFLVGRVVHGLLVLLPMVLGAAFGVWLANRLGMPSAPAPGIPGKILIGLTTLAVAVIGLSIGRPASTAPILGPDGEPLPGSIAEFVTVEIGGVEQVLMIRGRSMLDPVLLHLAGGPGGTDLGAMRDDTALETDFVVAVWEQRGTGKSYASSIDPVDDLTLEQAIADTLEVTDYLRDRFGQDRIYLAANSWGTIPAVFAVQRHPERYRAYVGTGQMVNNRLTDQMFYEDTLAWAETTGGDGLAADMRQAGPPPYEDLTDYEYTAGYEHEWNDYPGVDDLDEMPFNTLVPENTWMDRINAARGMFDVNWFVYPQLQDYDFRIDAPRLEVPVYVVLGRYEARGRAVLARDWFDGLQAPSKELVVFEDSGHRPPFEQPGDFAALMRRIVAETPGAS